jgi:hypothetical protein
MKFRRLSLLVALLATPLDAPGHADTLTGTVLVHGNQGTASSRGATR